MSFSTPNNPGLQLAFQSVNQTTAATDQCVELQDSNGKWTAAAAHVDAIALDTVVVPLPSSMRGVRGVRYAWAPVPLGQQLFDNTALPASPFVAACANGTCTLVPAGSVPE